VIHAADDAAIAYGHGERLAQAIPGASLTRFEECGHSIHIERSDDFNDLLRRIVTV
jgi:pimeloyl-ACP methyl ester carboxylesterase